MTKIRKKLEKNARRRALIFTLEVFIAISTFELSIIMGMKINTELTVILVMIGIPVVIAVILFFAYKNVFFHEEKLTWGKRYVRTQIKKEKFVQVETDKSKDGVLSDLVDYVAVPGPGQENDTVIVAIVAHDEEVINVQELPSEQFEEIYNIIEEEGEE